jgi:hypothetical protein
MKNYKAGDFVVYTRQKISTSPGRRARNIAPAAHGESYSYEVDKYWTIQSVSEETGTLDALTRSGKVNVLSIDDDRLRRAHLWEILFLNSRFPRYEAITKGSSIARG